MGGAQHIFSRQGIQIPPMKLVQGHMSAMKMKSNDWPSESDLSQVLWVRVICHNIAGKITFPVDVKLSWAYIVMIHTCKLRIARASVLSCMHIHMHACQLIFCTFAYAHTAWAHIMQFTAHYNVCLHRVSSSAEPCKESNISHRTSLISCWIVWGNFWTYT